MDIAAKLALMAVLASSIERPPTTSAEFRYEVLPPVYNSGRPPPTPLSHPPYHPTPTTTITTQASRPEQEPQVQPDTQITRIPPTTKRPVHLTTTVAVLPSSTLPTTTRRPWSPLRPSGLRKGSLKPKATSARKRPPPPVSSNVANNEGPQYNFNYVVEDDSGSFSHQETHDGQSASGTIRLRLPKTHQTFNYVAG